MSREVRDRPRGDRPLVLWAADNISNEVGLRQELTEHGYAIANSESGVALLEQLLHHHCSFLIVAPPIHDMDLDLLLEEVQKIGPHLNICLINERNASSGDVPPSLRITRLSAPITGEGLIRAMTRLGASPPARVEPPVSTEWVTQLTLTHLSRLGHWDSMCDGLTSFARAFHEHLPLAAQALLCTEDDEGACSIRAHLPAGDDQLQTCYQSVIRRFQQLRGKTGELPRPEFIPYSDSSARNPNGTQGRTVTIPIMLRHEINGMMALVQAEEQTLSPSETSALYLAVHQLVYAYDARRQAIRQAHRDGLTGCLTHTHILESVANACRYVKRYGTSMALVLLDLDHFKAVNDTYGHQTGDAALVHLADILRSTARESDIIGRYGGDEFVIVLPQAAAPDAAAFAARFLKAVRRQPLHMANQHLPLSVSAGIAALTPDDPLEPSTFIARADEALYAAKRAGGNKARVWTPPPGA